MSSETVETQENMAYRYCCSTDKGMRRYMEDVVQHRIESSPEKIGFFAVFDGHGGKEAASFAYQNLWKNIKTTKGFESEDPVEVEAAIKQAFIETHLSMEKEIGRTTRLCMLQWCLYPRYILIDTFNHFK